MGAVMVLFHACKSPFYTIQPSEVMTTDAIVRLYPMPSSHPSVEIRQLHVFRADIEEKLVVKNAVSEFTFSNTLSQKTADDIGISAKGGRTEMYFIEIAAEEQRPYNGDTLKRPVTRGMLFGANFSADGDCLGFGPVYTGSIDINNDGINRFTSTHMFRIRKQRTRNGEVDFCKKGSPELVFFYNGLAGAGPKELRFSQVVQISKNKISGINKSLVYDVAKIFNDPDALRFLLLEE